MQVDIERIIPIEKSFQAAKESTLEKSGKEQILFYKNADLKLISLHPEMLNPVALYLLKKNLDFQKELRHYLFDRYGIDTLQLSSVVHLKDVDGKITGLIPPYVEIAEENINLVAKAGDRPLPKEQILQIPLLIDGLHRAWMAMEENLPVMCIVARGIDPQYQYASYPVGWRSVEIHDEVPKVKKYYRRQDPYTFMRPLDSFRLVDQTTQEYGR